VLLHRTIASGIRIVHTKGQSRNDNYGQKAKRKKKVANKTKKERTQTEKDVR